MYCIWIRCVYNWFVPSFKKKTQLREGGGGSDYTSIIINVFSGNAREIRETEKTKTRVWQRRNQTIWGLWQKKKEKDTRSIDWTPSSACSRASNWVRRGILIAWLNWVQNLELGPGVLFNLCTFSFFVSGVWYQVTAVMLLLSSPGMKQVANKGKWKGNKSEDVEWHSIDSEWWYGAGSFREKKIKFKGIFLFQQIWGAPALL